MKNKKLLISLTAVFSVFVVIAVFLMIWFWGDRYGDFRYLKNEFAIPDLKSGGSPQGLANYYNGEYEVKTEVTAADGTVTEKIEKKNQNFFFISSYMPKINGKKQASRVYVVGQETGYIGFVTLKNMDGTPHTGHVGGIAINHDYMWISSQLEEKDENGKITETGTVFVAKASGIKPEGSSASIPFISEIIKKAQSSNEPNADNSITFSSSFNAQGNASFLYYYDADMGASQSASYADRLYVGEFYRKGDKYGTLDTHKITTPESKHVITEKKSGGDKNTAFAYEYNVNASTYSENPFGLYTISSTDAENYGTKSGQPMPQIQKIFSLPSEVQGFARTTNGKLVLSVSYGLKNSKLYYYDWDKLADTNYNTTPSKLYNELVTDENGQKKNYEYEDFYREYGNGKTLPYQASSLRVYFVDSTSLLRTYDIPCMSEGLCVMKERGEERVYVLFESGARQYRKFVRQILTDVYSFIPERKR